MGYARPKVVLKTSHLMRWAEFIAEGMYYLSSKKLLHMDLAARNILLALPGINSDEFAIVDPADLIPKISDFGLSRYLIDLQNIYQPLDPNKKFPVRWLPLETLRELKFSTKSDVFALGVTYWEMFSLARDLPYMKEGLVQNCPTQLINFLESGRVLQQPEYAPEEMWTIMLECWQKNPADRPDFETIRDDLKDANKIIAEMQESNRRSDAIQQNAESSSTKPPYVTVGFTAESGGINLNFSADSNDGSSNEESFADNDLDFSDEGSEARDAESEIEDENGISNCEVGENVNTVQNI
ncbi:Megakaryocyte-associated tyrosine-protein kinase [Orchesella cincta]|uniref:Megakaryocyte-associated tyrosine-protein kinase n=1 Tax=Orchesella cincta TaxID=48709 RepID=A0A1D2MKD2_ORCCI|nr:Megakaryocyte-associated tyrosine-protein kinase [Orchesella cincta]